ncbi:GTP-binding protein rhb1 [Aspergillus udagawae]|uniref:GTP-binding protein rhb1 n=1 Tax=Aspergillus udagawae TaxID=91492 RepID=A0A8H3XR68_9EURO|nr:GTP-binding protein rhb1 [Aspergillus udagawae]
MKEDTERRTDPVRFTTARHRKGNHATPKVPKECNESPKTSNPTSEASEMQSPGTKFEHLLSKDDPPGLDPVDKMLHRFQGQSGKGHRSAQNKRRKLDVPQKTQQGRGQDVSHQLRNSFSRMVPRDKRDSSAVTDTSFTDGKGFAHQSELKLQIGGQDLRQATSDGSSRRKEVSTTVPYLQSVRMKGTISKNKNLSIATEFATSSSQFQSNSKPESRTQITARRRLVDSLGPLEPSVEDAVRASGANDDTEVDLLPRHSPRSDSLLNSRPKPSSRPVKMATESANKGTAETSGPVSSRVGGCRVTYARQRSFLDETSIVDNRRPSEIPASTTSGFVQRHRKYGPEILSSHSSHLGDGESSVSGPIRGIHELRQAGDNSRFRSAIELIFEDIEDAYNTTSGRCSSFVQLCEKLLDRQFVRRFLEHGFHERLVGCIDRRLDVVSASFALCACELINSCDTLSHISLISHWSNVLVLSPVLLPMGRDLLSLSQLPTAGLSRSVQMSIKHILPRLSSTISGDEPAFRISPQFVALSSIQSCLVSLNNKGGSIEPISATLSDHLVKLLMPERDETIKFPVSRERFRTLALIFSILESYATVFRAADNDQNYPSLSSLSRLHEILNLSQCNQGRQLRMYYIRAILNLTNNDPNLCNEYATPELVNGLVNIVMSEIRDASDDVSTGEDNSLNTLILVLGVLINMTEKSESARALFLRLTPDSTPLIQTLLERFYERVNLVSEAHTAPTVHRQVAVGYLSILLLTLCFSDEAISQVRRSLDNRGLTVVLSTAGEFLQYYRKVDSDLNPSESRKSRNSGLVARLEHIIQQIQLRESTLL